MTTKTLRNKKEFELNYIIGEIIGKGSYGHVFRAVEMKTGRDIAVKIMEIEKNELEPLKTEIAILKECSCENIVKYYGNFIQKRGRNHFEIGIMMEFCELGSIGDILERRKIGLTEPVIASVCRDVLRGLHHLHNKKKMHRDVKGDNILLNRMGEAKLADFGVSGSINNTMTRKTVVGTPFYLAPEVIENEKGYGSACDIWGLGITLIELAELKPPMYDEQPFAILTAVVSNPPPKLQSREKWSEKFHEFLSLCLTKDPQSRPPANELLQHSFLLKIDKEAVQSFVNECVAQMKDNFEVESIGEEDFREAILQENNLSKTSEAVSIRPKSPNLVSNIPFLERVWIPHSKEGFVPATVIHKDGHRITTIADFDGATYINKVTEVVSLHTSSLQNKADLVTMDDLNEPSLFYQLKSRFLRQEIYTYVGTILISINPYQDLPLFTPTIMDDYSSKNLSSLPPHIYGLAQMCFGNLCRDQLSQSVIIAGESGAGKTECTKIFLQYLVQVAHNQKQCKQISQSLSPISSLPTNFTLIEKQIVEANVILESFGNAKTSRNNNSSRFGKFIKVLFQGGKYSPIIGASINTYLLEKSRVVIREAKERNFHVFYQLFFGATSIERTNFFLPSNLDQPPEILGQNPTIQNIDDIGQMKKLRNSMKILGIQEEEQANCFRVLSIIVHLGSLKFISEISSNGDISTVQDKEILERIAGLCQCSPFNLHTALCTKTFFAAKNKSMITVKLNSEQARQSRDALAKTLYGLLFDWLVIRINKIINPTGEMQDATIPFIGLLDIFGFEVFDYNGFEQLCINYANEKLQQYFTEYIFKIELSEYENEGIGISQQNFNFIDNLACVQLFEKPMSLFSLLDEECLFPKGTDITFVEKIATSKHPNLFLDKKKVATEFAILHYAGKVTYNSKGFLDKNKETIHEDLLLLMKQCQFTLFQQLFHQVGTSVTNDAKKQRTLSTQRKSPTVSGVFRDQLNALIYTLRETHGWFIRCIKPNSLQMKNIFEPETVLTQLSYLGILEAVRIRKLGFPIRRTFQEFFVRYKLLYSEPFNSSLSLEKKCQAILHNFILSHQTILNLKEIVGSSPLWLLGKSKVFLKENLFISLETERDRKITTAVQGIQNCWVNWNNHRNFQKLRKSALLIQTLIRALQTRVAVVKKKEAIIVLQSVVRLGFSQRMYLELKKQKRIEKEKMEKEKMEKERIKKERIEKEITEKQNSNSLDWNQLDEMVDILDHSTKLCTRLERTASEFVEMFGLENEDKAEEKFSKMNSNRSKTIQDQRSPLLSPSFDFLEEDLVLRSKNNSLPELSPDTQDKLSNNIREKRKQTKLVALHAHIAKSSKEISFTNGETFFLLKIDVSGWCRIKSDSVEGKVGWAPKAYFVEINEEELQVEDEMEQSKGFKPSASTSGGSTTAWKNPLLNAKQPSSFFPLSQSAPSFGGTKSKKEKTQPSFLSRQLKSISSSIRQVLGANSTDTKKGQ